MRSADRPRRPCNGGQLTNMEGKSHSTGANYRVANKIDNSSEEYMVDDLEPDCSPFVKDPLSSHSGVVKPTKDFTHYGAKSFHKNIQDDHLDSGLGLSLNSGDALSFPYRGELSTCEEQLKSMHIGSRNIRSADSNVGQENHSNNTALVNVAANEEMLWIFSQDEDGDSNLHLTIIQGNEDIIKYCISRAPRPEFLNLANNLLQTPLHLSVIMQLSTGTLRLLLLGGADVTATDHRGDTPLHIACRERNAQAVMALLRPFGDDEVNVSAQQIPQNLEKRNYEGQTCLHLAGERSCTDIVHMLLRSGANINAQDGKCGKTILHYASERGDLKFVTFLLQFYSLNVNCRSYSGQTPLMLANGMGYKEIVLKLYQAGAEFQSPITDESDSEDEMEDV